MVIRDGGRVTGVVGQGLPPDVVDEGLRVTLGGEGSGLLQRKYVAVRGWLGLGLGLGLELGLELGLGLGLEIGIGLELGPGLAPQGSL